MKTNDVDVPPCRHRAGYTATPSTYFEVFEPLTDSGEPPVMMVPGGGHSGSCSGHAGRSAGVEPRRSCRPATGWSWRTGRGSGGAGTWLPGRSAVVSSWTGSPRCSRRSVSRSC